MFLPVNFSFDIFLNLYMLYNFGLYFKHFERDWESFVNLINIWIFLATDLVYVQDKFYLTLCTYSSSVNETLQYF